MSGNSVEVGGKIEVILQCRHRARHHVHRCGRRRLLNLVEQAVSALPQLCDALFDRPRIHPARAIGKDGAQTDYLFGDVEGVAGGGISRGRRMPAPEVTNFRRGAFTA